MTIVFNKTLAKRVLRRQKNRIKQKIKAIAAIQFLSQPFDFEFEFSDDEK